MPIAAAILVLTYVLIALQRFLRTRLKMPSGALLGAALMAVFGGIPADKTLSHIPADILLFLTGMLVIAVYLQAGNAVSFFAGSALRLANSPVKLLIFFTLTGAIVSALALNLTAAILLAPLALSICRKVGEKPAPYLIALILGINLGSAATAMGSPQTMFIVSLSGMGFWEYSSKMMVVSAVGTAAAIAWLLAIYGRQMRGRSFAGEKDASVSHGLGFTGATSVIVSAGVIIALFLGAPLPVAAMAGAAVLVAINPQPPKDVLSIVNWPLIIFIGSLFVIVGAAADAGIAGWLGESVLPFLAAEAKAGMALFVAALTALTALFSGVPAAALVSPALEGLDAPKAVWFAIAVATTFAGNVTLYGSLSNLSVIEQTAAHDEARIGALEFLRAGLPVTLITLAIGLAMLTLGG